MPSLLPGRKLHIVFFLFFLPVCIIGQSYNIIITGKVIDNKTAVISFAYVSLLTAKDSLPFKTIMTDINGNFEFKGLLASQNFLIRAHCLGFNDNIVPIINENEFYNIVLSQSENVLDEVVISNPSSISPIQFQPDKTVIYISESINSSGSDLIDLLRKTAGIKIAGDDKILIDGKDGVLIFIDGILLNLKGNDLFTYLKGISTSNIEKMEIISNPSAKYDADGKGIINIKTKKGSASKGLNSSISLNGSIGQYYPKYNEGFLINYRDKKINIYGNYDFSLSNSKSLVDYLRKQKSTDNILTNYHQYYNNSAKRNGNAFKTGIDFNISNHSVIGLLFNGNFNAFKTNSQSTTDIYENIADINSILTAKNDQTGNNKLLGYNMNYKYTDSTEKSFTIDANHTNFNFRSNSYQPNIYTDSLGNIINEKIFQNYSLTGIQINSIKADYSQKISNINIKFGTKASQVKSDNNLDFYTVENKIMFPDTGKTNVFNYEEKILAAYINCSLNIAKWSGQFGFRIENTLGKSALSSLNTNDIQSVKSNYKQIFPNGIISYQFTSDNAVSLMYNRRINRPAYQDLNPFVFVFDELSYAKGNPFLRPQVSDNLKFSYIFKKKINTYISYTNNNDFIFLFRDTLQGKTFVSSINIDHQKLYSVGISVQHSLFLWWDFNSSLNVRRQEIGGIVGKTPINMKDNTIDFYASNSIEFLKSWRIECSGFVNSKYLDAPAYIYKQWSIDIGIQKKVFNNAGNISITLSDLFNSLEFHLYRDFAGLYYTNLNKWESRQLKLSFNYKFGNSNLKPVREREKGSRDEEKRIK